jgi:hypothetical protein
LVTCRRTDLTLAAGSGCRLLFVLMESDYGVETGPERADGWLGALLAGHAESPVLRLWLSSHVASTAEAIAEALGDRVARRDALVHANGARGGGFSGDSGRASIVPMEASLLGLSDDQVTKLNTAWEIVQTSTNAVDYGLLARYLDEIGVYDALDLRQCDELDIAEITKCLKKIQRKVFTTCVAKEHY